jgi:hypothetical protein
MESYNDGTNQIFSGPIPFSLLTGVDVSRVRTMIVGVGDRADPKHGSGLIYIDDIQYGRPAQ